MKNMKKILGIIAVLAAMSPVLAHASTNVALNALSQSVKAGQQVTVTIAVQPSAIIYTSKISLSYSSDLLQETGFTLASNWMALSQSGYDNVDPISGTIIKTAGYPGGLSNAAVFGTVTFTAKESGTAHIAVAQGTQILDANNQNNFNNALNLVAISIAAQAAPTPASQPTTTAIVTPSLSANSASSPLTSLSAAAGSTGLDYMTYVIILIIVVIVIIGYFIWKKTSKKQ